MHTPSRRQFLQSALCAAAASLTPLPAFGAQHRTPLGFSLYGMKNLPLDDALRICSETGYSNVELALNPGYPTEPKLLDAAAREKLRQRLKETNLDVSALMLNISLLANESTQATNLQSIADAAQLALDLAPTKPPVIETVLGGKPAEWETLKDRMADSLRSWAETAEAHRALSCINAHVNNAVNSPERLLWLLEKAGSPAIQVAYDYSHFQLEGIPLEQSLDALLPHTRFVHVKDSTGALPNFHFVLPGEGQTDYPAYFKLLQQHGYAGPIVVEVSAQVFNQPGYDPVAAAKKCQASLAAALTQAGLG